MFSSFFDFGFQHFFAFSGTDSAIRLYKKEMLEVVTSTMQDNPIWAKKAQAATMLSRIIKSVDQGFSPSEAGECNSITLSVFFGDLLFYC